jgi:hypothetical protein
MYSQTLFVWNTFQSMVLPDKLELESKNISDVVPKVTVLHVLSYTCERK